MHGIAWARVARSVYSPFCSMRNGSLQVAIGCQTSSSANPAAMPSGWPLETHSGLPMSGLPEYVACRSIEKERHDSAVESLRLFELGRVT